MNSMDEENDFEEIEEVGIKKIEDKNRNESGEQEESGRIRIPRNKEIAGIVAQRLGGNRMEVNCSDGKTRNCRVPGRFKRKFWLRAGDAVLIEPWPDNDYKGDVIFQYKKGDAFQLRKRGFLEGVKEGF